MSLLEFFEWDATLAVKNLSPAQKITLKVIQGEPLDTTTPIKTSHPYQVQEFKNEVEMFKAFSGKDSYEPNIYSDVSLCWGRRCLEKGTEVLTPKGPIKIEDLKKFDQVYGVNSNGDVELTTVLELYNNGVREVRSLEVSGIKIAASTEDHRWLTSTSSNGDGYRKSEVRAIKDFTKYTSIERRLVKIPCGDVSEPHAYAIGALLGDGCCSISRGKNDIWVSSETDEIPNKLKEVINADTVKRSHESNYNWVIRKNNIHCNHYEAWLKGKKAHEKTVDLNTVNSWDRESCLQFLAGLIDTDGSVYVKDSRLSIQFGCQSYSTVEAFQLLFYKLWQHKLSIHVDVRDKYVNGPVYYVRCSSNLYSKRALFELGDRLIERKRWKPEYSDLIEQRKETRLGAQITEAYQAETFDIAVSNETNLFLLANEGLISENSGKSTTLGAGIAIYFATQFDYTPYLGTSPHATIPIVSPTKEQAGEIYAAIKNFFLRSVYLFDTFLDGRIENFQDEYAEDQIGKKDALIGGQIKLNNKVIIKVIAADISKLRGMAVPFAIMDENAFMGVMDGTDAKNTDKAIYEALSPALSQFQQVDGMALILKISSPNGQSGLMYGDFENSKDPDVLHLQVPSWYANPTIPVKYLEKQKKKGLSFFNREYGAEYTASEVSYLDPNLIDAARMTGIEELPYNPKCRYVAVMDYATKQDYWAFGIGHKEYYWDPDAKEKRSKIVIDRALAWRGLPGQELDPAQIIPLIALEMKRYRVAYCIADQYAFASVRALMQQEGVQVKEFKVAQQSKLKYMYSMQINVNSKTLAIIDNPLLIKHLKDLREKRTQSGKVQIQHAPGCHDDYAQIVALICYQFDKTSPIYIGYTEEDDTAEIPASTKDVMGRHIAVPTAEEVAETAGVRQFHDNRAEYDEKGNKKTGNDDDNGSGGFWFIF
jgi:hypothetical protein